MEYKNIIVPFVEDREIKRKADKLREKYWGNKIPVKIETIIEIKLKIKIIPIPNLFRLCSVDSQISSDFSSILVDEESYLNNETNRLHFSLAHEFGHYVLHEDLFSSLGIKSVENVVSFVRDIPDKQYYFLETQANMFASHFLLPRESLRMARQELVELYDLKNIDQKMVNSYIADNIAKKFEVSSKAAELGLHYLSNFNQKQND